MALGPEAESLQTLKEQERAEGVECGPDVDQYVGANLNGEGGGTKRLDVLDAMIVGDRLSEFRKLARISPVELPWRG